MLQKGNNASDELLEIGPWQRPLSQQNLGDLDVPSLSPLMQAVADFSGRGFLSKWLMCTQTPVSTKSEKSTIRTTKTVTKMSTPGFMNVKLKNTYKTMRQANPFDKQKALGAVAAKVKNTSQLKNIYTLGIGAQ